MSFKKQFFIFFISLIVFSSAAFYLFPLDFQKGKVLGISDVIEKNVNSQNQGNKMSGNAEGLKQKIENQVCEHFDSAYSSWKEKLEETEKNMEKIREETQNRYQVEVQEGEEDIEAVRAQVDANFERHIQKMLEKYPEEEKQEAILAFGEEIEQAMETRREKVDQARETFKNRIRAEIQTRKTDIDDFLDNSLSEIKNKFQLAKQNCEAGGDSQTIRNTVRASLENKKEEFSEQKVRIENQGDEVSLAVRERNEAIKKANEEFQLALKEAQEKLETIL